MKFSNRKIIVFVFVFCIPLWSFNFPENILLNKIWTFEKGERNISFYRTKRKFDKSKFSFQLLEGGKLKIQQSGWCGTPPIEYEVVEGTWDKISDSVYILKNKFWGGEMKRKIRIFKLTSNKLEFKIDNSLNE